LDTGRTHDGAEVDLVIERDDGSVVALEIKAGSRVGDRVPVDRLWTPKGLKIRNKQVLN
jgi:hypothetical protein